MQKLALSRRVEGNLAVLGSGGCGGKATRLLQMGRHLRGQTIARIPKTDVLTTEVTNVIKIDPIDNGPPILDKLKLKPGFKAIRSSAHAEDSGSVMGVNCPGVFDTRFHDFRDGDLISLANTVATVAASAESSKATAYAERNGITNGGMAVIIQSVVGTNVGEGHFGPLFS
ncbi:hypothetical protein HYT84_04660, partial [Candidatus Micrarchaeota archaeon]|nr:hypothetical protein [Candidatus Micrarchaeota archaeon]